MPHSRISGFLIQRLQHCRPIQLNVQYLWSSEIMRCLLLSCVPSPTTEVGSLFMHSQRGPLALILKTCEWSLVLCQPPCRVKIPLSNTSSHLTSLLPCRYFLLVPFICLSFHPYKGIFPRVRLHPITTSAIFSKATTCQGTQNGILYPLLAPSVLVQVSEKQMPRWNQTFQRRRRKTQSGMYRELQKAIRVI